MSMSMGVMSLMVGLWAQPTPFSLDGGEVRLSEAGVIEVVPRQGAPVTLAVVLWHGDWKYLHQAGVKKGSFIPAGEGVVFEGDLTDAEGTEVLHLKTTLVPGQGTLSVTYDLSKTPGVTLPRGVLLELRVPREAYQGRRQFVPPGMPSCLPARRSAGGTEYWLEVGEGRALVVQFSSPTSFSQAPEGASYLVRANLAPSEFDQHSMTVTLALRPLPERFPGEVTGDRRPLRLGGVEPAKATVLRHGLYEARLDLAATYDNPFDPEQIAVDAHFKAPSGQEIILPCFYAIEFTRQVREDVEELTAADKGSWRLRFTPEEVGTYSFYITARDASGETTWRGGELTVTASDLPGFVRVSPVNRRYLELSTGQSIFPIGHNLPTYHVDKFLADREIAKMHAGGENYNRWWMYSRELGLEWEHALGWYRQTSAWRMDFVLRLAEQFDFRYMICFDTHQDFRGTESWEGWPNNPYNAVLGGPCQTPAEFFTNAAARAQYKKRLRYIVARYGWSPRVLCWEFGNEFEGWPDTPSEVLLAWHREMSDYLRELDPYRHLITTSFWTPAGRPEVWNLPNIDIVQTHHYANAPVDMARLVATDCREKLANYDKPHIYGEIGLDSRLRLEPKDPQGYYLHECIWAALMSGAASSAMSWWHESYIDKHNLYGIFKGLAEFVRTVPLSGTLWTPLRVEAAEWLEKPELRPTDITISPSFGWGKPEVTTFEVSPVGEVNDPAQVPQLLHGQGHRDLQTPITFVVTYPEAGKFAVHVDTVSKSGLLKVFLDGKQVAQFDLPCGESLGKTSVFREQWNLWETTYDQDFTVDVPAGRHEIRLENEGGDWIRVQSYKFLGARDYMVPDHLVLGLGSPHLILLWVRNNDFTWYNAVEGKVARRPPCRLTFSGAAPGEYTIETWDTWEGKVVSTSHMTVKGGELVIDLPAIERDVALKLIRKEAEE